MLPICHIYIDGLVQERRNSIANALELRLSCTDPYSYMDGVVQNCGISMANALEVSVLHQA